MQDGEGRLGQIGRYWLSRRRNSAAWCRTWFDASTRQTCRASLGTDDLDEAKLALAAWITANAQPTRARSKGLSDGYIRRILAVGQAALNRAYREGEITYVPRILLSLAPEAEPRERLLTIDEAKALFAAATATRHRKSARLAGASCSARGRQG